MLSPALQFLAMVNGTLYTHLLGRLLPAKAIRALKNNEPFADPFNGVTMFFADVVS